MVSGVRFAPSEVEKIADEVESKSAHKIVEWALGTFGLKVGMASSFGAEDVAIIDMMVKVSRENTHVFTLDTGRLNQETYDVIDAIRKKYGIEIHVLFPDQKQVEDMVRSKGMNLMYDNVESRKLCCEIRKVYPLNRALAGLDAWMTGLRRDQAATRASVKKVEIDAAHGNILKINPLADWTVDMVWDYIKKNDIPYNKLHDKGYPSIGCEPCTRAVMAGEDPRAGRWWWENAASKECGLHFDPTKKKLVRDKDKK